MQQAEKKTDFKPEAEVSMPRGDEEGLETGGNSGLREEVTLRWALGPHLLDLGLFLQKPQTLKACSRARLVRSWDATQTQGAELESQGCRVLLCRQH